MFQTYSYKVPWKKVVDANELRTHSTCLAIQYIVPIIVSALFDSPHANMRIVTCKGTTGSSCCITYILHNYSAKLTQIRAHAEVLGESHCLR